MSAEKKRKLAATGEEIDEAFENGEDMEQYFDFEEMKLEPPVDIVVKSLGLSLPGWLVRTLDDEAKRRAISRKALINVILVEWADEQERKRRALGA